MCISLGYIHTMIPAYIWPRAHVYYRPAFGNITHRIGRMQAAVRFEQLTADDANSSGAPSLFGEMTTHLEGQEKTDMNRDAKNAIDQPEARVDYLLELVDMSHDEFEL